jgi:hypothetical protein
MASLAQPKLSAQNPPTAASERGKAAPSRPGSGAGAPGLRRNGRLEQNRYPDCGPVTRSDGELQMLTEKQARDIGIDAIRMQ